MGGCRRTKVHLRRDTIPASTGSLCRYLYGDTSHPKDKEVFFMQKKELYVVPVPVLDTYALTVCALLTALSVVLARLLTIIPSEVSRFSL